MTAIIPNTSMSSSVLTHSNFHSCSSFAAKIEVARRRRSNESTTCSSASSESIGHKAKNDDVVLLPPEFTPSPYTVICGRKKACRDSIGNRRLQIIASMFVSRYAEADTKDQKSKVVSEIVSTVEDACPEGRGAFVRYQDGRWWEVEEVFAREKVSAVLRDSLHDRYRSSTKAKLARRQQRRSIINKVQLQEDGSISSQKDQPSSIDANLATKQISQVQQHEQLDGRSKEAQPTAASVPEYISSSSNPTALPRLSMIIQPADLLGALNGEDLDIDSIFESEL